jgi:hypothetical protein
MIHGSIPIQPAAPLINERFSLNESPIGHVNSNMNGATNINCSQAPYEQTPFLFCLDNFEPNIPGAISLNITLTGADVQIISPPIDDIKNIEPIII